jgi:chaperone required for assembly of F1-ATPase
MSEGDSRPIIVPPVGKKLRRRFYKQARAAEADGLWRVELDGRPLKTPARAVLAHTARALMDAVAEEWAAQGDEIDPAGLPLTRLANTAADAVRGSELAVADDILRYAASDLIFYRAEAPEDLRRLQAAAWDGVLAWAASAFDAHFTVTAGIMPVEQPREAVENLAPALARFDAFALTALHCMTTLTGSALLTLAHAHGRLTLEECWHAAHVDEDFQAARWGQDTEAAHRRAHRLAEMTAASRFFALTHG